MATGMAPASLDLRRAMAEVATDIEQLIDRLLPATELPEGRLIDAMRYGSLDGGKRLRPLLTVATGEMFNVSRTCALRVAAAVEFVHSYSLIHDDLPAMDAGELRRGRPTVHRQFDEATAILAGDALLTDAFAILTDPATHEDPKIRCDLVSTLSRAAGSRGMVAGQMLDLIAERQPFDIGAITRLQRLKTGDLFAFCCEAGAVLGRASPQSRQALQKYAHDMGLAFQIADDLLDFEGREEDTGKSVGRDQVAGKATFVSILGADRARQQAQMLRDQAVAHLEPFREKADMLRAVADFVIERKQ